MRIKITEKQLKMLMEEQSQEQRNFSNEENSEITEGGFDDPEMQPGEFNDCNELLQSSEERLSTALQLRDWYLVKEVFTDISHFGGMESSESEFEDSTEFLSKGAMEYPMNEQNIDEMGGPFHYDEKGKFTPGEEPEHLGLSRNSEKWNELFDQWSSESETGDLNSLMDWLKKNVKLPRGHFDYAEKSSEEKMNPSSEEEIDPIMESIKSQFKRFI